MTDWHMLRADEVTLKLETDPGEGLSREEAQRRLEAYGPNELSAAGSVSPPSSKTSSSSSC